MNQIRKDVLNGWKEIAAYLGRDPRTVERWEKQRSLPVRRLPGSGRATVYALVSELDAWLASSPVREPEVPRAAEPETAEAGLPPVGTHPGSEPRQVEAEKPRPDGQAGGQEIPGGRSRRLPLLGIVAVAALLLLGVSWLVFRHRHLPVVAGGGGPRTVRDHPHNLVPPSPVAGVEQLYMRGCYQSERRTPESLHRAQDAFTAALVKDPHYAPAYAGLASTYILLREYATLPDAEAYTAAKKAASEALNRDPELPQAHAALAFVEFFWEWRPGDAEREFRSAIHLDPELALSHHWYGSMLTHEGRFAEGLRELEEAQRLDPSSSAILTTRALAIGLGGHRGEGADLLQEAITDDRAGQYRNPATMHNVLGMLSLLSPRDIPKYLAETMIAAELREDTRVVDAMRTASDVYRRRGETAMWRALLEDEQRKHARGGPTYNMARFEAEVGAKDQALDDLADLYSRHDPALIGISVDPLLAPLHGEPRFGQLRSAMGLPALAQD